MDLSNKGKKDLYVMGGILIFAAIFSGLLGIIGLVEYRSITMYTAFTMLITLITYLLYIDGKWLYGELSYSDKKIMTALKFILIQLVIILAVVGFGIQIIGLAFVLKSYKFFDFFIQLFAPDKGNAGLFYGVDTVILFAIVARIAYGNYKKYKKEEYLRDY